MTVYFIPLTLLLFCRAVCKANEKHITPFFCHDVCLELILIFQLLRIVAHSQFSKKAMDSWQCLHTQAARNLLILLYDRRRFIKEL
jgi:hypothetical protein